jgi:hypothetical protein
MLLNIEDPLRTHKQEMSMTPKTKLSILALAAVTVTTTLSAGGSASANNVHPAPGHEPVLGARPGPGAPPNGYHAPTGVLHPFPEPVIPVGHPNPFPVGHGPVVPPQGGPGNGGSVVSCHPKTGCSVTPGSGDRDHDPGYGGNHGGYYRDRGYFWGYRPEVVVGGVPGPIAVPAPAQAGPVQAVPGQAQAAPAHWSVPVAQMGEGRCTCLTKQNLPDGSVLFQDTCTRESAMAAPQAAGTP